ncbi:MAG: hypothetical protein R3F41_11965 [Gammaproteobacteria bacterium]
MPRSRSNFFFIWAIIVLVAVFLGFAPTFYLRPLFGTVDRVTGGGLPFYLVIHGLAMTAWYAIFVAQTYLVRSRNFVLHRNLGITGLVVAGLLIISGFYTMIQFSGRSPEGPVTAIMTGNTIGFIVFVTLLTIGVLNRKRPEIHKRAMLIGSIAIIGPAFTTNRMFGEMLHFIIPDAVPLTFAFKLIVLGSLVWFDLKTHKRVLTITMVCAAVTIAGFILARTLRGSELSTWYYNLLAI